MFQKEEKYSAFFNPKKLLTPDQLDRSYKALASTLPKISLSTSTINHLLDDFKQTRRATTFSKINKTTPRLHLPHATLRSDPFLTAERTSISGLITGISLVRDTLISQSKSPTHDKALAAKIMGSKKFKQHIISFLEANPSLKKQFMDSKYIIKEMKEKGIHSYTTYNTGKNTIYIASSDNTHKLQYEIAYEIKNVANKGKYSHTLSQFLFNHTMHPTAYAQQKLEIEAEAHLFATDTFEKVYGKDAKLKHPQPRVYKKIRHIKSRTLSKPMATRILATFLSENGKIDGKTAVEYYANEGRSLRRFD